MESDKLTVTELETLLQELREGPDRACDAFAKYLEWPLYDAMDRQFKTNTGTLQEHVKASTQRVGLACVDDVDEFKAWYIESKRAQAARGTLLASFDVDEDGADPVGYLVGSTMKLRVVDFLEKRTTTVLIDAAANPALRLSHRQAVGDEFAQRIDAVAEVSVRVAWAPTNELTTTLQTAGAQTWSNLDNQWSHTPPFQAAILGHVEMTHESFASFIADIETPLKDAIRSRAGELDKKAGMASQTRRKHERRISKMLEKLLLYPVNASELQRAFNLPSVDAAAQRISRYRMDLRELVHLFNDGKEFDILW